MKKIALMLMLLAVPAQVQAAGGTEKAPPITLTDAQISMVKEAVADRLRDPESARFGRIKASGNPSASTIFVCGIVNAKNGYGGYAGRSPFATLINDGNKIGGMLIIAGVDGFLEQTVTTTCASFGIDLTKD
jgi:hypothetical protein